MLYSAATLQVEVPFRTNRRPGYTIFRDFKNENFSINKAVKVLRHKLSYRITLKCVQRSVIELFVELMSSYIF